MVLMGTWYGAHGDMAGSLEKLVDMGIYGWRWWGSRGLWEMGDRRRAQGVSAMVGA